MKNQTTDLERFKKLFNSSSYKELKGKIEFRSRNNLDNAITEARKIIADNNLKLKAITEGSMASRGAFEVIAL